MSKFDVKSGIIFVVTVCFLLNLTWHYNQTDPRYVKFSFKLFYFFEINVGSFITRGSIMNGNGLIVKFARFNFELAYLYMLPHVRFG